MDLPALGLITTFVSGVIFCVASFLVIVAPLSPKLRQTLFVTEIAFGFLTIVAALFLVFVN